MAKPFNVIDVALNDELTRRIREELAAQCVSARELARRMGMPQPTLQDRLRGRVEFRPSDIEAIAAALDVPAEMFFRGELPESAAS